MFFSCPEELEGMNCAGLQRKSCPTIHQMENTGLDNVFLHLALCCVKEGHCIELNVVYYRHRIPKKLPSDYTRKGDGERMRQKQKKVGGIFTDFLSHAHAVMIHSRGLR